MEEFKGRVAVVTGGASGIGLAMAKRFAAEGMHVVIADVEQQALDAAEAELTAGGTEVLATIADVSKPDQVEALARASYARFGAVHVLCNNAGVAAGGFCWEESLEDWQWVLGVNLWGVIHGLRSFIPRMLEQESEGHVVNTASMAGLTSAPLFSLYNVSKHGVVTLSECLHHELAMIGSDIKVSVLCPSWVDTKIADSSRNRPGGPRDEPDLEEPFGAMSQQVRQLLSEGLTSENVADQVLDAIRTGRLYILTHPELNGVIKARAEDIVSGFMTAMDPTSVVRETLTQS